MKMLLFINIICLTCLSTLFAKETKKTEKTYIEISQLNFDESGMAVSVNGKYHKLSSVYRDKIGYYILPDSEYTECPNGHFAVKGYYECDEPSCRYNPDRREEDEY